MTEDFEHVDWSSSSSCVEVDGEVGGSNVFGIHGDRNNFQPMEGENLQLVEGMLEGSTEIADLELTDEW